MSLLTLPVELLHRIFDQLDATTILLSLRNVCTLLRAVTNTYTQYELDFRLISKANFDLICCLVRPDSVVSLTLSNDETTPGQIKFFLSFLDIHRFDRLRSLTLEKINDIDLNRVLIHATNCSLISLSFYLVDSVNISTLINFSIILAQPTIHKLKIRIDSFDVSRIPWPVQCTLQHLTIDECARRQFFDILHHCPHLRTLVLIGNLIFDTSDIYLPESVPTVHRKLTSLTFKNIKWSLDDLEILLALTPSLVHLRISSNHDVSQSLIDGSRWEQFILTKLPLLNKFEFFFNGINEFQYNSIHAESLIAPFRTLFWLEHLRCIVTCDYCGPQSNVVLYSIPNRENDINYDFELNKISCSTSSIMIKMDGERHLTINLTKAIEQDSVHQNEVPNHLVDIKVTTLILHANQKWPHNSVQVLSTLIDLSYIVEINLEVNFDTNPGSNMITNIVALLEQTSNLRSLALFSFSTVNRYLTNTENICSMVPCHVKHLKVKVNKNDQMKMVLERLKHLSSIVFYFRSHSPVDSEEIIKWLKSKERDFTYWENDYSLQLWLGKNGTAVSEET